ncbi:MAG: hypothetical protein N3A60_11565, partial [Thermanaerothrix sp.]|nr:hypothetical protein [Thermanaerothrix sp.]
RQLSRNPGINATGEVADIQVPNHSQCHHGEGTAMTGFAHYHHWCTLFLWQFAHAGEGFVDWNVHRALNNSHRPSIHPRCAHPRQKAYSLHPALLVDLAGHFVAVNGVLGDRIMICRAGARHRGRLFNLMPVEHAPLTDLGWLIWQSPHRV